MKELCVILGGGNTRSTAQALDRAEELIGRRAGKVEAVSGRRVTEAWGFSAPDFTNEALLISTDLAPHDLLLVLQKIEKELGRDRESEKEEKLRSGMRYASRTIDLDILLYGERKVELEDLQIPHPRLLERSFAMEPLGELYGMSRTDLEKHVKTIMDR